MKRIVSSATALSLVLTVALVLIVAASAVADPAAWSSFQPAVIEGISTDQPFTTSLSAITYTLTVGAAPRVQLSGEWYNVTQVWGFFVVAEEGPDGKPYTFNASLPEKDGWVIDVWPTNGTSYANAGWLNQPKDYAIYPNESDTFTYNSLDLQGHKGLLGLHVSLDREYNGTLTLGVKNEGELTPEPSSVAGLGLVLSTLAAAVVRRRK